MHEGGLAGLPDLRDPPAVMMPSEARPVKLDPAIDAYMYMSRRAISSCDRCKQPAFRSGCILLARAFGVCFTMPAGHKPCDKRSYMRQHWLRLGKPQGSFVTWRESLTPAHLQELFAHDMENATMEMRAAVQRARGQDAAAEEECEDEEEEDEEDEEDPVVELAAKTEADRLERQALMESQAKEAAKEAAEKKAAKEAEEKKAANESAEGKKAGAASAEEEKAGKESAKKKKKKKRAKSTMPVAEAVPADPAEPAEPAEKRRKLRRLVRATSSKKAEDADASKSQAEDAATAAPASKKEGGAAHLSIKDAAQDAAEDADKKQAAEKQQATVSEMEKFERRYGRWCNACQRKIYWAKSYYRGPPWVHLKDADIWHALKCPNLWCAENAALRTDLGKHGIEFHMPHWK